MSSMPREALKTRASKPGVIGVPSSRLNALARTISSFGSERSAGVIWLTTSTAVYPSMLSAPTLKIWMTPSASVAMLEKFALFKIALCRAPAITAASLAGTDARASGFLARRRLAAGIVYFPSFMHGDGSTAVRGACRISAEWDGDETGGQQWERMIDTK